MQAGVGSSPPLASLALLRCAGGQGGRARDGETGPGGREGAAEARRPESRGGRVSKLGVQGDVLTPLPGAEELGTRGDVGGTLVPATQNC